MYFKRSFWFKTAGLRTVMTVALFTLLLSSCVRYPSLVYLQTGEDVEVRQEIYQAREQGSYRLQVEDVLSVQFITTGVRESSEAFNSGAGNVQINEAMLFVNGYTVSAEGKIMLPVIGEVEVVGLSVEEVRAKVQELVKGYFKEVTVTVRLVSFRVSVLGEVARPGLFYIYNDRMTILQALAQAGDMTVYGSREKVRVVREEEGGTRVYIVNLTDAELLSHPCYLLKPNDVIYVEPARARPARDNVPVISLVLSGITASILTVSLIFRVSQ